MGLSTEWHTFQIETKAYLFGTRQVFSKIIFWWMYTSVTLEEVKLIPAVINCNNPIFLRAENVHNLHL